MSRPLLVFLPSFLLLPSPRSRLGFNRILPSFPFGVSKETLISRSLLLLFTEFFILGVEEMPPPPPPTPTTTSLSLIGRRPARLPSCTGFPRLVGYRVLVRCCYLRRVLLFFLSVSLAASGTLGRRPWTPIGRRRFRLALVAELSSASALFRVSFQYLFFSLTGRAHLPHHRFLPAPSIVDRTPVVGRLRPIREPLMGVRPARAAVRRVLSLAIGSAGRRLRPDRRHPQRRRHFVLGPC